LAFTFNHTVFVACHEDKSIATIEHVHVTILETQDFGQHATRDHKPHRPGHTKRCRDFFGKRPIAKMRVHHDLHFICRDSRQCSTHRDMVIREAARQSGHLIKEVLLTPQDSITEF